MPKHFGPHNMSNGYAAMGNSRRRPRYKFNKGHQTVAEAIAAARHQAAAEARRKVAKKK